MGEPDGLVSTRRQQLSRMENRLALKAFLFSTDSR